MLISDRIELQALIPSNVSTSPERLLTLIEQTERSYIVPILGSPLYDKVTDYYQDIVNGTHRTDEGVLVTIESMVAAFAGPEGKLSPMQQLIKLLQVPLVYMTLANFAGVLAISFNNAGINVVSADNYEPADKASREEFVRDCFMAAHKGIEQVLLFLEKDAKSPSPSFLTDWRESSSFYQHNGLLITTATAFHRIVPIDESRETFLSLVPRIQYVQDYRIRPQIGDTLIDALIQYATFGPQQTEEVATPQPINSSSAALNPSTNQPLNQSTELCSLNPSTNQPLNQSADWTTVTSTAVSSDAFFTDLRVYLPKMVVPGADPGDIKRMAIWNKLLSYIRTATAFYVEAGEKKLARPTSENWAMQSIERAKLLILSYHTMFDGLLEDSPLPIPATPSNSQPSQQSESVSTSHPVDRPNHGSRLFDPFDTFYN